MKFFFQCEKLEKPGTFVFSYEFRIQQSQKVSLQIFIAIHKFYDICWSFDHQTATANWNLKNLIRNSYLAIYKLYNI